MIARGHRGRLDHENVGTANIFHDLNVNLTVAEGAHQGAANANAQAISHFTGQCRVGVTGKQCQVINCHEILVALVSGVGTLASGWGARIRTWEYRNQNPVPYHLATPHQIHRQTPGSG